MGTLRTVLGEAAACALADRQAGAPGPQRPWQARHNAEAIILAAHTPVEVFDVLPVPLVLSWATSL